MTDGGTGTRPTGAPSAGAKAELRRRVLARRATRTPLERAAAGTAIRDRALELLAELGLAPSSHPAQRTAGHTVALYASGGGEPDTHPLLESLLAGGARILLPVLRPDRDLDWAAHTGPADLTAGPAGMPEPVGPRLGVEALAEATVVLVPGLAVDRAGNRLGRGGGSYDRALPRAGTGALIAAVVYDDEVLARVPTQPHDRPVHAALTPVTVHRFDPGGTR